MKYLFSLLLILCSFMAKGQISGNVVPDPKMKIYVVEASCGQCNFGLEGRVANWQLEWMVKPILLLVLI